MNKDIQEAPNQANEFIKMRTSADGCAATVNVNKAATIASSHTKDKGK